MDRIKILTDVFKHHGVSNIIWPQYNIKNQNWYNNKKIILTKNHYNYRSQNKK